jgi:hypothetical protein
MSPAAIDLGGVGILPVEEDFERIDAGTLREIIEEVTLPDEIFRDVTGAVAEVIHK